MLNPKTSSVDRSRGKLGRHFFFLWLCIKITIPSEMIRLFLNASRHYAGNIFEINFLGDVLIFDVFILVGYENRASLVLPATSFYPVVDGFI